ncbi:putative glucose-6-phosphate 1-epimerase [Carex rostrata]
MSKKASFTPPKAIRGGIPICFPQFGTYGHLETNGFAKHMTWTIEEDPPKILQKYPTPKTKSFVDLLLLPSQNTNRIYPYTWELRLRVILGQNGNLTLIPRVRNMNLEKRDMMFTFALQAHFNVSDVGEVRLEGLEAMDYYDHLNNNARATEYGDALIFEKEVDKAYLETPGKIAIIDHAKRRTYVVFKEGLPDCVLWNPWDKQAKKLPDFGDKEFRNMLCLQPAIIERPLKLKPGQEWTGRVHFTVVNSSYFSGPLEPNRPSKPPSAIA